ncbi:hypothetical protein ACODYM_29190 [Burkholderia gladioli]|uniref:hypothetical protein n=1 Tax=Burkholderia gladioli TaxID=28095 RepID=UPI003B50D5D6
MDTAGLLFALLCLALATCVICAWINDRTPPTGTAPVCDAFDAVISAILVTEIFDISLS